MKNKGASLIEILFFIVMAAFFIVPFVIAKLWWWVITTGAILLLVAIIEGISMLMGGKTISQRFWKFSENNKIMAWAICFFATCGWVMLMAHLLWKIIFIKEVTP